MSEETSDGEFLRDMADGTRAQIPEVAKTYDDVVTMQALAARMDAIAKRLDDADANACAPTERSDAAR